MLSSSRLHLRAAYFRSIRRFFYKQDFLEVDTPVRNPVLIPEATIEPIEADGFFLQTSPEQCMKRILALGEERIFQICPCFRRHERGRYHLEEFMMLEWYRRDADYHALMADCKDLILSVVQGLIVKGDFTLPKILAPSYFSGQWQMISVAEAFAKYSDVALDKAVCNDLFDEIIVEKIEPQLGKNSPTFLYDYPVEMASLARVKKSDPRYAERFELYIHGVELANGFSELTDPVEQRERFEKECKDIVEYGKWKASIPEAFLHDLERLDCAAGIAMGLDRLLMILEGEESLAKVVSFIPEDFS